MHELPAVEDLIRTLDEESEKKDIRKITGIHLVIGELSSYVGECIETYFDLLGGGHSCEGAKLYFRRVPARFRCTSCGHEFDHDRDFSCPVCKGDSKLIPGTGKEFMIESIDTE